MHSLIIMTPNLRKTTLLFLLIVNLIQVQAQTGHKKRILFLGNSYTYVNNVPVIMKSIAWFFKDTIESSENLIGGYTLKNHSNDANSLFKINQGNWDFVVLQEQSQLPSFPDSDVERQVFPFARKLDSLIHLASPCAKTVFYMTWGRKNGDASNCAFWPPVCTYQGMDSLLSKRYIEMAQQNQAQVSPVGAVWKYIRTHNPELELYDTDENHPSQLGSYAVACALYTTIFKRNPLTIAYNFEMDTAITHRVHEACKTVIYDSLSTWNFNPIPSIDFQLELTGKSISCQNLSDSTYSYFWDFGDGETSTERNPIHTYEKDSTYRILLTIHKCKDTLSMFKDIQIRTTSQQETFQNDFLDFYPNPANSSLHFSKPISAGTHILITALDGSIKLSKHLESECSELNLNGLTSGVYLLRIENKQQFYSSTKKLLVIQE